MTDRVRTKIPGRHWWIALGDNFDKVARELIKRALAAEKDRTGHECGHEFVVTVSSRLHASGPGEHTDAAWSAASAPVTVRAHNLRDALLVAATRPLSEWFADQEVRADG